MEVSNKYKWLFACKYGGRDDGPNDAMGQGFVEAPLESFVREAIQNSISTNIFMLVMNIGRRMIKLRNSRICLVL